MSNKPLLNKIIISTHSVNQNDNLSNLIKNSGAEYYHLPLIQISENKLTYEELGIIKDIEKFKNIIFTSKNGVKYFFRLINEYKITLNKSIHFFVIGKSTGGELETNGFNVFYENEGNDSISFAENLKNKIDKKDKTLLALGTLAPDTLLKSINSYSNAFRINVYKTEQNKHIDDEIFNILKNNDYDLILFSSPSAIKSFKKIFPEKKLNKIKAACIGNITGKAFYEQKAKPLFIAKKSDSQEFVNSIVNYFNKI